MSLPALTGTRAWRELLAHRDAMRDTTIGALFEADPGRFERCSLRLGGMLLDYSKNPVTAETLSLLCALARERDVMGQARRMFEGDKINTTEGRAALHTALRAPAAQDAGGRKLAAQVREARARMRAFSDAVRGGTLPCGRITDVVNIGIGGSHLGPALAVDALAPYADGPRIHFITNIDPAPLARLLQTLDPHHTLFIVASKTFTTLETSANARTALAWAQRGCGESAARTRFAAVTEDAARAAALGIAPEHIFPIWDWVGGRYSLWSAVGLPVALAVGMDVFEALLAGAHAMDRHFLEAPLETSLPVVLALLGIWYNNFLGAETHAVLPYDDSLALLPAHLQQLDMESSGKEVTRGGHSVDYATGPVIWGTVGNNGQHAFFQLLHQGTRLVPSDFIVACRSHYPDTGYHEILIANFLAQTAALAFGGNTSERPHDAFPGNHPSNAIMLDQLTPHTLGMLLALYEHKVFVQNAVWDINPFDQPGVELGKRLVARTLPALDAETGARDGLDASTRGLAAFYNANRKG